MLKKIVITLFVNLTACNPYKTPACNEIVDIYYSDAERHDAYHLSCPYTRTPKGCKDCGNTEIRRSELSGVKKHYKLKGLPLPSYMSSEKEVLPPVDNGYL